MAAKGIDFIEHVPAWLPKIGGMTIKQVSPCEVLLHRVPSARVLEIGGIVKARVADADGLAFWRANAAAVGSWPGP